MMGRALRQVPLILALLPSSSCATLQGISHFIQPPRFVRAADRSSDVRLLGPSLDMPAGGATVRLWTEVSNPNSFGFTLSTLRVSLSLEGAHATTGDFPLGLPLEPRGSSVIPLDLKISFTDIPGRSRINWMGQSAWTPAGSARRAGVRCG